MVNSVIDQLKLEPYARSILDNKNELFVTYSTSKDCLLITYFSAGNVSFSKIQRTPDGIKTQNATIKEIKELNEKSLFEYSRIVNRRAYQFISEEYKNENVVGPRTADIIRSLGNSKENHLDIKSLNLKQDNKTVVTNKALDRIIDESQKKLKDLPLSEQSEIKNRYKESFTDKAKNETISYSLKDVDSKENAPDICEIIKQSKEAVKTLPVSELPESKSWNFDMNQVKKGTADFKLGEKKAAKDIPPVKRTRGWSR